MKPPLPFPTWLYILIWLGCAYLFATIFAFTPNNPGNVILGALYFIDFGVHEESHLVFAFLPSIFDAAAGSLGEMTLTLLVLYATLKYRAYMAAVFACVWVMMAFNSAGQYMADARAQKFQLIGFGDTVIHDWHFVFGQLGWLDWDTIIGSGVMVLGDLIGALGLLFGVYLFVSKLRKRVTPMWQPFRKEVV